MAHSCAVYFNSAAKVQQKNHICKKKRPEGRFLQLLARVIRFDGAGLYDARRVAALPVLRLGGDRSRVVAIA